MKNIYDVAVIGGGIIGLSIAYYLTSLKKRVTLIEKNHIGSGASGACDDMILLQSKKPGILLEMAMESLDIYKKLSEDLDIDVEFENRGGMILIEDQKQLDIMNDYVNKQKGYGLDVEIIDKKNTKKRHPFITNSVIASTYSDKDCQVNPLKIMKGFLGKSISRGLELKKNTQILRINQEENYWSIDLKDGTCIETQYVVNAAGAWAGEIGKLIGTNIPIHPKKGQVIVTEKIPQLGKENVWSAGYIVSKLAPELANNENPLMNELGVGFACTRTKEGNYLIGSTREDAGFDKSNTFEAINILVEQAVRFFPILKNVNIIRCFAGFRPVCDDGKIIIGEVADKKGFFIASGHGGDGIALAPITGKLIAQLIIGQKPSFNIDELGFSRFKLEKEVKENYIA